MKTHVSPRRRGFALPMTILVVVSLLIMVIGLIAMLSLERKTARSYSHAARAEMALDSGLNDALSTLTEIASKDDTLTFRLEDPKTPLKSVNNIERQQFFTYGSIYNTVSKSWRVIPLFSGMPEKTSQAASPKPNAPDTDGLLKDVEGALADIKDLGRLADTDVNIPRAKWVELPQPTTTQTPSDYKIRYAWWIEDLNGRLDGRTNGVEPREKGLNTNELAIYTIFNNTATTDGTGPEDKLIEKRLNLLTSASTRLAIDPADANKIEPYLTYSPKPTTPPVQPVPVIPQGFGYAEAGQPMMDLNEAVTTRNVDGLANKITTNLPGFAGDLRVGGFKESGQNYAKTLAASIIDYADTDSNATVGTGYRGVDSYPFVNEMYDRYEWLTASASNTVQVKVTSFIELWNPSQKDTTKGQIQFENVNNMVMQIPPGGEGEFSSVVYPAVDVQLPPNGFKVLQIGEKIYTFPRGSFAPSELSFDDQEDNNFRLKWNGVLVDTTRGGVQRQNSKLKQGASQVKWKGNGSPAHEISIGQEGDPRASMYIAAPAGTPPGEKGFVYANTYITNTSWGGRNLKRGITPATSTHREVKMSEWPDRGSDSTPGIAAGTVTTLPTSLTPPANQPNMAPAYISNLGYYTSAAEMGNIFDPCQWEEIGRVSSPANPESGGGCTLAIGRPEFAALDKEGRRSAQLIDLFYAKLPANLTNAMAPNSFGTKINVNTASREVLRTLVAGVKLSDDPTQSSTLAPPRESIIGDLFADAVIASRQYSPLRGPSDLALVKKDPAVARDYRLGATAKPAGEPFFGSRFAYPSGAPPDTWDDAGREELFKKVINLVSFQGKSFRIVVAGEAIDKAGNVLGRQTKEIHILLEPERDSSGILVANGTMKIRKLYEKSF